MREKIDVILINPGSRAAQYQNLGAEFSERQHLLVRQLRDLARVLTDIGISGIDAIDIGVNVAARRVKRRRHRNCRRIGSAAT